MMKNNKSLIPFKLFCNMAPPLATRMAKAGLDISPEGVLDYLQGIILFLENLDILPAGVQKEIHENPFMNIEIIRFYYKAMSLVTVLDNGNNDVEVLDPFLCEYIQNYEIQDSQDRFFNLPYGTYRKEVYPGLPDELKPFNYYICDSGHCIMIIPKCFKNEARKSSEYWKYEVPCPVKYVLEKGYKKWGDYIVCDVPYNDLLGLKVPKEYFEY